MLRRSSFIAALLTFVSCLQAEDVFVEAKAAYYRPTESRFRKVYGGSGIYGIEASFQAWRDLYAWTSTSCFYRSGTSIGKHNGTNITFIPLGIGLKYLFPIHFTDVYLGVGGLGTYAHIKNHSRFVSSSQSKWAPGAIIKVGALLNVHPNFFIDLFSDYSFIKMRFSKGSKTVVQHESNLGGWSIGLGLGFRFGRPKRHQQEDKKTGQGYSKHLPGHPQPFGYRNSGAKE